MPLLLITRLKKIIYSGKNIGRDLNFRFNVKDQVTQVKTRISFGQHKSFNQILFQGTFAPARRLVRRSPNPDRDEGGSLGAGGEDSVRLPIRVAIIEEDTLRDTGSGSSSFNVQLQATETQIHSFSASVIARGGDQGRKATFTFIMEANVEKALKVDITRITTAEQNERIRRVFNLPNPFLAEADPIKVTGDIIPDLSTATTFYAVSYPARHGAFNPAQQQATDKIESVFTPSARDININANVTKLGYGLAQNQAAGDMPVTIVEQRLIQMIWAEARGRTQRERIGVGWVARNRVDDTKFPRNLTEVLTQPGQFATSKVIRSTVPAPERARYDEIVDESGQVQRGTLADPTLGSIGFVTPMNSDIPKILNAFDSRATGDAQKLDIRNPKFVGNYQAVLLNERSDYEKASRTTTEADNPFVFFRRKVQDDPTVRFNTGGN